MRFFFLEGLEKRVRPNFAFYKFMAGYSSFLSLRRILVEKRMQFSERDSLLNGNSLHCWHHTNYVKEKEIQPLMNILAGQ